MIILIVVFSIVLCSCDGLSNEECLKAVKTSFPGYEVYTPKGGSNYIFFVKKDTLLFKVKCTSLVDPKEMKVEPLFKQ